MNLYNLNNLYSSSYSSSGLVFGINKCLLKLLPFSPPSRELFPEIVQIYRLVQTCIILYRLVQTCIDLYRLVQTCIDLYRLKQIYNFIQTYIQLYRLIFRFVWTCMIIYFYSSSYFLLKFWFSFWQKQIAQTNPYPLAQPISGIFPQTCIDLHRLVQTCIDLYRLYDFYRLLQTCIQINIYIYIDL